MRPKVFEVIYKFTVAPTVPFPSALNWNAEPIGELTRCKDCKHRPTVTGEYENGLDVEFPDWKCPCRCDDGWYNWIPDDNWFCGNGERKEE